MFSGIIETIGEVQKIITNDGNQTFIISSELASELRSDQSLAHNGVCLTVEKVSLEKKTYQVTAIQETLEKSMLGTLSVGDKINLERSLLANGR
ncbi:MAG: riboflavin synthase, partial [Spirochaetia bacterium]|nr:riboflavin synthase [Spirochaetia bacterium]